MSDDYDVGDELLVPMLYDLMRRHVDEVRETYGPRLPRLRSPEFYAAPEHVQVAVLVVLGSAWLFGMPGLHVLKEVSLDVHGGADWRQLGQKWMPLDDRRPPRVPARCSHCHQRQGVGHEGAA